MGHQFLRMKWLLYCTVAVLLVFWSQVVFAQADPTPPAEGAVPITVEVLPNDSLWAVAARAGISLTDLLALNGLTENAVIQPGQQLIVGYSMPEPTATEVVVPTERATLPPPPPSPTAVPPPPTGICLTAFSDINGNGIQEAAEPLKTAVAFTIFNDDVVIANYVTDGVSEPYCIDNLAEGTYHITRSLGPDEVLTTPGDRGIIVRLGAMVDLAFGSVRAGEVETAVSPDIPAAVIGETAVPPTGLPAGVERALVNDAPRMATVVVVITLIILLLIGVVIFMIRNRQIK